MNRLILLVLVAVAAWYGWKHWSDLRSTPRDEAVIMNGTGRVLVRLRLTAGGQTFVRERIADGEKAEFRFPVTGDGVLALKWQYEREELDKTWSGGLVAAGPMRTRHVIQMMPDDGVVWNPEKIADAKP